MVEIKKDKDSYVVKDIIINGISHYYNSYSGEKIHIYDCCDKIKKDIFENELLHKMVVPEGYLNVEYYGAKVNKGTILLVPYGGFDLIQRELN